MPMKALELRSPGSCRCPRAPGAGLSETPGPQIVSSQLYCDSRLHTVLCLKDKYFRTSYSMLKFTVSRIDYADADDC